MMVKSGLKNIFEIPPFGSLFSLNIVYIGIHKSAPNPILSNKNNHLPTWTDFKINFSRPLFTIIFRAKMLILCTYSILST